MTLRQYITPRNTFLLSAMLIAIGLGCSNILMSWGQIGIVIAFLWDGKYKAKFKQFIANKRMLALTCLYFLFVIGLVHTSNFTYAFHDLKVKLPLLIVPFFIWSFFPLAQKELKIVFHALYLGALITMIAGLLMYLGILHLKFVDMRSYSPFIANLRVGTLLVFCIFMSLYFCFNKEYRFAHPIIYFLFVLAALIFLLLIQSLTGIVALTGTFVILNIQGILKKNTRKISLVSFVIFGLITSVLIYIVRIEYKRVHDIEIVDFSKLPKSTIHGAVYKHDTTKTETINGHYVYLNISNFELQREWDKRSEMPYYGLTKKGWPLKETLIRYLASKGLKKNAEAVISLSDKEIRAIENGKLNYLSIHPLDIRFRFNQLWIELDKYEQSGDPNHLSFATRLETWKVARHAINKSLLFGSGTGDVKDMMETSYTQTHSKLLPELHLNPHQQYFTTAIAIGLIGLFVFAVIILFPVVKFRELHILFLTSLSIAVIGMLDEDTLETQAGCTQFIFMYVLTYMMHKKDKIKKGF